MGEKFIPLHDVKREALVGQQKAAPAGAAF